ncbi:MAG: hypothetical protein IKE73_04660 [Bacilli bacterium]|nr:hypothetical protein [Bacilli bacterium]
MSVVKFLILNDEHPEEVVNFISKFSELNPNLEYVGEKNSSYFCSEEIDEKYIVPDDYVVGNTKDGHTYVVKNNKKLLEMYYFPYVGKNEYFSGNAMSLKPLTKYNFNTEQEYYLSKATEPTMKKYGVDRLKTAVNAAKQGIYNGFTREEKARDYAKKIKPREFSTLMMNTLEKDADYEKEVKKYFYENDIENLYYYYLSEKVKQNSLKK